jgi:hypothetical protein
MAARSLDAMPIADAREALAVELLGKVNATYHLDARICAAVLPAAVSGPTVCALRPTFRAQSKRVRSLPP